MATSTTTTTTRTITATTEYHCRSGKHCTGSTSDGPAVTAKSGTICAACIQDLQRRLEELPILKGALRAFLGVVPKTALQSRVSSTPEPACPINPRVDELIGDIEDVLDRTEGRSIADLIRQPAMEFRIWIRDVQQRRHLDGVHRALDVRRTHGRANAILGFDRVWEKRHAPCWNCGLMALGNYIGDSTIQCAECESVITLDEYDTYCIDLANK